MIKTNIKMRVTPEQSRKVQEICFENKNLKEETLNKDYLTKCTSQPKDLESALKKIANLHIALNKKVEKNKNQALEITKLLEQKKDLQDKLNQANRVVKLTIDNSSKLANFLDEKNEIIKENKLNQFNSMSNYVDDFHYKLKEKGYNHFISKKRTKIAL